MQAYLYSLLLVLITLQTAFAEEQNIQTDIQPKEDLSPGQPNNINNSVREEGIKHDLKYNGCNGFIRGGYIQTHTKTVSNQQAYGLGGELGCGVSWGPYFQLHASAFTAINPGFNSGNKDEIQGDFFDENKNSYITLGEAVMTLSYADLQAHLGPQRFNSPHMDQDDLRLLPNIFEAYLLDYHLNDEIYLGSGFIRTAKGWENNGNAADFIDIGEAFGGTGAQSWIAWGKYQQGYINASAWYYYIKDVQQIFFVDVTYQNSFNDYIFYDLGVQFDMGRSVGAQSIGEVGANTLGIYATISSYGMSFTTAYNKNFGQSAAVNSVGGGPFFTSMEQMTMDAVNAKNAQALLFNLEYQPYFIESMNIGVAAGDFQGGNAADFHTQEFNTYLSYQYNQMITVDIMYAYIKDLQADLVTDQLRVILGFQF
ncbi:conserved hypothetical protein [Bathymodiolus platifrons methanotrophic gill symbiont]|uniref:OprD family outer membrane porin n=1 Tax=Bathymodiolus platifrons methanotrophic gill symbiont TaxID=113268 RepID=UPI000B64C9D1|nr:OprD family outer membrane porin [Bathymodiolus platifrons methanotrophic gill symbiont]TXL14804.1 hypothetical protein BMR04_12680 [Methylococcaceae bacterium HT3]GAW86887.1 conserved hypothetical protein [Bathymodiolus platifrons methanotrophic gill symbiont]GFO76867.1 imipenem/basic amino acid-specific outer membrane pore [Bathymodiolus platifrons methanotrophic gill symbiont]